MDKTERRTSSEPRVIVPEIDLRSRWIFRELWKTNDIYLDLLVDKILTRYRYDQPLDYFGLYRENPVVVKYHPNGMATFSTPNPQTERYNFGDCVSICMMVVNDKDFWGLIGTIASDAGCEIFVNLVTGRAPQYFTQGHHHFLTLNHQASDTCLLIDPAFQKIGLGEGYSINPEEVFSIVPGMKYKNEGMINLTAGSYKQDRSKFDFRGEHGVLVLGLGVNGVIIDWSVAVGESKLKPIFPVVGLIGSDGGRRTFYNDPIRGIVRCVDKRPPKPEEKKTLQRFFAIASEIDFRFGND